MSVGRRSRVRLQRLLAACVLLGSASLAPAEQRPVAPVSVIQIPIELDLQPLFRMAESSLPSQTGHWPQWRKWHGIDTRYRAWRGPLLLAMQGDVLLAQAHVRYQLQARKGLMWDIGLKTGCGVDEPPRQALVGIVARLMWGPDWSLHPQFRVLPTRFLDRCEVTVADIDVSPLVDKLFEERIESTLLEAMRTLAPRLAQLRGKAGRAWQNMQRGWEVLPGLRLHAQPLAIALAPPQGAGARLQTTVSLTLRAGLSADPNSPTVPTPLPPLVAYQPTRPELRFALDLELDYPTVATALSHRLSGRSATIQDKKIRLGNVRLAARGEDLLTTVDLSGDLAGKLTIMSRPGFDPSGQTLRLEDVDFVFDAEDPDQELLTNLFYNRIRARIETEANSLLAQWTTGLHDALASALAQHLPPYLTPDLSSLKIAELRFQVQSTGLTATGTADGVLKLGIAESPE